MIARIFSCISKWLTSVNKVMKGRPIKRRRRR
jgi:hypothetical protein